MMKFYISSSGKYIGAFDGIVPPDSVEVDVPPEDARQVWDGAAWGPIPVDVPPTVSRAQGKAALITAGIWPDVLTFVGTITDTAEKALAEVALNDTTHWRRDSPTLQAIATALGITSEQMDDLFIGASNINL